VICEALSNGSEIPPWARRALPSLPEIMAASNQLARKMERLALDTVEAALLVNHIGQEFDAVVISGSKPGRSNGNGDTPNARDRSGDGNGRNGSARNGNGNGSARGPYGVIQIADPAVTAKSARELEPGTKVGVRLVKADFFSRDITFELLP